jgi:hypothetical protein
MTVKEVAQMAGCTTRSVTNACVRLGYKKVPLAGSNLSVYRLTEAQVKKLTETLHYRSGRPSKS